jgi:hypothetical protein
MQRSRHLVREQLFIHFLIETSRDQRDVHAHTSALPAVKQAAGAASRASRRCRGGAADCETFGTLPKNGCSTSASDPVAISQLDVYIALFCVVDDKDDVTTRTRALRSTSLGLVTTSEGQIRCRL